MTYKEHHIEGIHTIIIIGLHGVHYYHKIISKLYPDVHRSTTCYFMYIASLYIEPCCSYRVTVSTGYRITLKVTTGYTGLQVTTGLGCTGINYTQRITTGYSGVKTRLIIHLWLQAIQGYNH